MGAFWGVNYIAAEIESPFGDDPNDLPLQALQKDMNKSLWVLLHPKTQEVPSFQFDPKIHRKWDVVTKVQLGRTTETKVNLFLGRQTKMWTQGDTDSNMLHDAGEDELPALCRESMRRSN